MGQKNSKKNLINADQLSLQTLHLSWHDYAGSEKEYLKSFFLNEDIDCFEVNEIGSGLLNIYQQTVEQERGNHQYRCFPHDTKSRVMCVVKKTARTAKMFQDWTQNYYNASFGHVEPLLQKLLNAFFEDNSLLQFTIQNLDAVNYSTIDQMLKNFQKQYVDMEITITTKTVSGKYVNCIITKKLLEKK